MLVRDDADEHYYYYYYDRGAGHHAAGEARRRGAGCVYIIETYAFPVDRSRSICEPVFGFLPARPKLHSDFALAFFNDPFLHASEIINENYCTFSLASFLRRRLS